MLSKITAWIFFAAVSVFASAEAQAQSEVKTVPSVDLNKYSGKWYEIARFPNRFQRNCAKAVTATYTPRPDGKIKVLNECLQQSGKKSSSTGTAKAADRSNAKLKVTFFWPFSGDYWVLALGPNYEYALIGGPSRKYLWVMSRTPQLDDKTYEELVKIAEQQGFDVKKLVKTPQA